jgi:hypothetical protein
MPRPGPGVGSGVMSNRELVVSARRILCWPTAASVPDSTGQTLAVTALVCKQKVTAIGYGGDRRGLRPVG